MNTPPNRMASVRDRLGNAPEGPERFLWGASASVCLGHVPNGTSLGGRAAELAGRSVLIATRDQCAAALALIELDGVARRLLVCTPDLPPDHLPGVVAQAHVDAIVTDHDRGADELDLRLRVLCSGAVTPAPEFSIQHSAFSIPTEWVLLTSGTTGAPKMLVHTFASLTAPVVGTPINSAQGDDVVWGTFYDIRRYGGL